MVRVINFIKKPIIVALLVSVLVFLGIISLRANGNLQFSELAAYDFIVRLVPKTSSENSRITVIGITEDDIRNYGRWPLTDETIAQALTILIKDKPRAVGLDIYRDIPVPPGREELNVVFASNPQIIGIMTFGKVGTKGIPPLKIIEHTDQVGFGDILVDSGGIVRRALLFLDDGENLYYSFALRLALLYLQAEGITPSADQINPQLIRLNATTIKPFEASDGGYVNADAGGYQFLLDFKCAASPFTTYSLSSLLSGEIPAEAITNKIIIIGVIAQSVKDFFYTPLSSDFDERQQVPGVVLHGQIANQILRFALDKSTPIKSISEKQRTLWILFWSLLGGLIGLRTHSVARISLSITGGVIVLLSIVYFAFLARWWIPAVPPIISFALPAVIMTAYVSSQEKKERTLLMQIFSKHVSKEIAEVIWRQREQFLNNGRPRSQKMMATVLFSDLRGFTTLSEKMDPQNLIDMLNEYMDSMAKKIMEYGGVIDNYEGDGIMAVFGVPLPRKNEEEICTDAINATACALAMGKEMHRLSALWTERGFSDMGMRIGIHTGFVVAGLLGSSERLKYTTLGDTVNIASRLESYDKELGQDTVCRILISNATLRCLKRQFKTERIGEVTLKGKRETIIIHRVLS